MKLSLWEFSIAATARQHMTPEESAIATELATAADRGDEAARKRLNAMIGGVLADRKRYAPPDGNGKGKRG